MSNGMSLVPSSTTTKDFYGAHHASVYIKDLGFGIKGDQQWEVSEFPSNQKKIRISQSANPL